MGFVGKIMGGKKEPAAPTVSPTPDTSVRQEEPGGLAPGENTRRLQATQRSQLVSGRDGTPTRAGISIPGRT